MVFNNKYKHTEKLLLELNCCFSNEAHLIGCHGKCKFMHLPLAIPCKTTNLPDNLFLKYAEFPNSTTDKHRRKKLWLEFFICRWRSCFQVRVYIIYISLLVIVRKTTKLTDNYLFNTFNRIFDFYPVDIQISKLIVSQKIWHRFSYCLLFNTPCQRSHGRFIDRWLLLP